jgi:hypothetical protein
MPDGGVIAARSQLCSIHKSISFVPVVVTPVAVDVKPDPVFEENTSIGEPVVTHPEYAAMYA